MAAKPLDGAHKPCPSHPEDDGPHECMPDERRCVYCGTPLFQNCNGCGRMLSIVEIRKNESRCESCL